MTYHVRISDANDLINQNNCQSPNFCRKQVQSLLTCFKILCTEMRIKVIRECFDVCMYIANNDVCCLDQVCFQNNDSLCKAVNWTKRILGIYGNKLNRLDGGAIGAELIAHYFWMFNLVISMFKFSLRKLCLCLCLYSCLVDSPTVADVSV